MDPTTEPRADDDDPAAAGADGEVRDDDAPLDAAPSPERLRAELRRPPRSQDGDAADTSQGTP